MFLRASHVLTGFFLLGSAFALGQEGRTQNPPAREPIPEALRNKLVGQFGKKRMDFQKILRSPVDSKKEDSRKLPGAPPTTDYYYIWNGYKVMLSARDDNQHVVELFIYPRESTWEKVRDEIAKLLELPTAKISGEPTGDSVTIRGIPGVERALWWTPRMGGSLHLTFANP